MSRKNLEKLENRRGRMLEVIEKEYSSNSEFCRNMDLSHNWVNYYENADDPPSINDRIISSLYEDKNISPLWITNGVGPYKTFIYDSDKDTAKVAEPEQGPGGAFIQALEAIQRIEQQPDAIKDIPLPEDLELKLAQLLVTLLERRSGSAGT